MDKAVSRRVLIKGMGACALAAGLPAGLSGCSRDAKADVSGQAARYWTAQGAKAVTCNLCPVGCTTAPGETGFCRARKNVDGRYVSLVYARPVSLHNDPIEKKPFNHYLPGTTAFSVGLTGCNLRCRHCQNWQISQAEAGRLNSRHVPPDQLVDLAVKAGSQSLAFTYNEPTTFVEYMIDAAKPARRRGLGATVVSNGYINEIPQRDLMRHLNAYKVDLKGFTESFYTDVCGGRLKPVLDSLERIQKSGVWLEIVNLVIPTLNDDEKDLDRMARWIVAHLGKDVPVHFTRFHPMYKIRNLPPTPVSTLEKAHAIAKAHGIRFPYVGNVAGHKLGHTYCPSCGKLLIRRYGYNVQILGLEKGRCAACKTAIPGVWNLPA